MDGKGWIIAKNLQPGDWLLDKDARPVQVMANERIPGLHPVHTLKLSGDVAFYANGVLVHDLCGGLTLADPASIGSQPREPSTRIQNGK